MVLSLENLSVLNTVIEKEVFTANLYENSLVEIKWDPEFKEVTKIHLMRLTQAIFKLGEGKKMRIYISTNPFMDFDKESRDYSTTFEAEQFTLANAVLIDNLGKKILYNFYLKFHKPNVPIRAFTNKTQALEWLFSIEDK